MWDKIIKKYNMKSKERYNFTNDIVMEFIGKMSDGRDIGLAGNRINFKIRIGLDGYYYKLTVNKDKIPYGLDCYLGGINNFSGNLLITDFYNRVNLYIFNKKMKQILDI